MRTVAVLCPGRSQRFVVKYVNVYDMEVYSLNLAILADDLTGGCDTGIQFADQGFRVSVQWNDDRMRMSDSDVLVVPTSSRSDAPQVAAAKVRDVQAHVAKNQRDLIYKKIDSTLLAMLVQRSAKCCETARTGWPWCVLHSPPWAVV